MEGDCIVIAEDSDDDSDESLPPFSQTSPVKRTFSGEDVAPSKKAAGTCATPDLVYDLTASPASTCSSMALTSSSNDHLHVEKRPLNSISVGSRFVEEDFNHTRHVFHY